MSMEIRQANFVIFGTMNQVIPCGIKIGPGEKFLAAWWTPTDNVGTQLGGYGSIDALLSLDGSEVILGVNALNDKPGSFPLRVRVFAMVDVPLIKVGTRKLFSDQALTKPETSLTLDDHAFLGVPVANTSDNLTVKSATLSLVFDTIAFTAAKVLLSPTPPNQLLVENISPGQTKNCAVKVITGKSVKLPIDLEIRLQVVNLELGVADTLVQKSFSAEPQTIHIGT